MNESRTTVERRACRASSTAGTAVAPLILALMIALPVFAATEKRLDAPKPGVRAARELTVTIDVKDAEVREILKSMQKQCGVKNLVVDPDVQGKGTFYFDRVPCRVAFPTVFRSLGIEAAILPNSVVIAGGRQR